MKCNVGKTEKAIRISGGILIIILGLYFNSWWGIIGVAPIITGVIGWCPVSQLMGVSTCKEKDRI